MYHSYHPNLHIKIWGKVGKTDGAAGLCGKSSACDERRFYSMKVVSKVLAGFPRDSLKD